MDSRVVNKWTIVVLSILMTCATESILDDSYCNYFYNNGCRSSTDVAKIEYSGVKSHRSCSVDDVTDDIKFTVLLTKGHSRSSQGIAKVNFILPDVECTYEVALLVNSTIDNEKDCRNHVFHTTDSYEDEIHSVERTICVLPSTNHTKRTSCQNTNKFSIWYEHVFTGCYAVRFTVDGYKYLVRGNKYLITDYTRKEVVEPKFRCYYEDRHDFESSKELVTFALSISVLAGTAGMILTLTPMAVLDDSKENACIQYSEPPLWEISTDDAEPSLIKNCSIATIQFDNDTYTKDTECNFALPVTRNASYCFKIGLRDERCHRQTIWNPPPDDSGGKPPCTWLQSCTRIPKNTSAVEYNGMLRGSKQINSDNIFLLPIAATVILIVLIVTGSILFAYRLHARHVRQRAYTNTSLRTRKITKNSQELDSVETTDDEMSKVATNNGDEINDAIILLYARGSPTFMSFMSDFRDILKAHCGCRVRDWYAASEWDEVATIGPAAWVANLLRHKHRGLWLDTPGARSLLRAKWNSEGSIDDGRSHERCLDEEAISDFRDIALPSVLDLAKRSVGTELGLEYSKHFVLRLEGFDASNKREDPFQDLSPHARYLIPYHLSELCSHLSWRTTVKNIDAQRLKTEEVQLRGRLIRMKINSS